MRRLARAFTARIHTVLYRRPNYTKTDTDGLAIQSFIEYKKTLIIRRPKVHLQHIVSVRQFKNVFYRLKIQLWREMRTTIEYFHRYTLVLLQRAGFI